MHNDDDLHIKSTLTHPATEHILQFFKYAHLPDALQRISKPFCELAHWMVDHDDLGGPELTVALRKLLEAKDAAVRSRFG